MSAANYPGIMWYLKSPKKAGLQTSIWKMVGYNILWGMKVWKAISHLHNEDDFQTIRFLDQTSNSWHLALALYGNELKTLFSANALAQLSPPLYIEDGVLIWNQGISGLWPPTAYGRYLLLVNYFQSWLNDSAWIIYPLIFCNDHSIYYSQIIVLIIFTVTMIMSPKWSNNT